MRTIAILTPSFFDYDGSRVFNGGGERYLMELVRLLWDMGHYVEVFQAATGDWVREHHGIRFSGLSPISIQEDTWPATNRRFLQVAKGFDLHIYFAPALAYPDARPTSLAICHGIWWDDTSLPGRRSASWLAKLGQALRLPSRIVANDTNIINWVRAMLPELESKFEFIPNFVDVKMFTPKPLCRDSQPFKILFPRRLAPQRGFLQTLEAARRLVAARNDDISFRFVGRGAMDTEASLASLAEKTPGLIYGHLEPEKMPEAYWDSDLVLIPSLSSEGTSLSCLEAMACGRPVIAGWVGGLCNLIIHEYNGLLIRVSADSLVDSILHLKSQADLRERFAERGPLVAQAHSLERWRERWHHLLTQHFNRI